MAAGVLPFHGAWAVAFATELALVTADPVRSRTYAVGVREASLDATVIVLVLRATARARVGGVPRAALLGRVVRGRGAASDSSQAKRWWQ